MPRYFTLAEAKRLLPSVERIVRDAVYQKTEFDGAERELNDAVERIRMAGGSRVNPGPLLANRARRDGSPATSEGRILSATSRPRRVSCARYTSPLPPAPMGARIS